MNFTMVDPVLFSLVVTKMGLIRHFSESSGGLGSTWVRYDHIISSLSIFPVFPVLSDTCQLPNKDKKKKDNVISEERKRKQDSLCLCLSNWTGSHLILSSATASAALYRTLITTAWLKIPWISVRDWGTWQKTKTPSSQKWQQHHQKQQQRTWRAASDATKTYLPGRREHHHPLAL